MGVSHFFIIAASAYLLGSLSFAIIICKLTLGKDIRSYGSGNAGLTNAYRTMGAGKDAARAVRRHRQGGRGTRHRRCARPV